MSLESLGSSLYRAGVCLKLQKRTVHLTDSPGCGWSVATCMSWTWGILSMSKGGSWGIHAEVSLDG